MQAILFLNGYSSHNQCDGQCDQCKEWKASCQTPGTYQLKIINAYSEGFGESNVCILFCHATDLVHDNFSLL